jgi:hypothetical protein
LRRAGVCKGRGQTEDAATFVINRDNDFESPDGSAYIVKQGLKSPYDYFVRLAMREISLEDRDACGLDFPEQLLIRRMQRNSWPQTDQKSRANLSRFICCRWGHLDLSSQDQC